MKRLFGLGSVVALLVAALAIAQWRKPHADVSPDAVLHFVGDTEQELSRLPMTATRLSDADEIRVGNELAERYKYMEHLRDDTEENKEFRRYIERVGTAVALRAKRKLPYKFHYIPERYMVNAFAIPGGHVYIGKGLLDLMDSEDELACVLGHEVEHIDRRHAVERLQTQATLRHLGLLRLLVELPVEVFQAGYGKEQELEADREGARLAVMSGYSATGASRMFEAFDRKFRETRDEQSKSPQEETARVVLATMRDYFRSHPASQERIAQINNLIAQEGWPVKAEKSFALSYLLWTDRAEIALRQHKYKAAETMAAHALDDKPGLEKALRIRADADFYQANFTGTADSYRELLILHPDNSEYARQYAFHLASADRRTAAVEFSRLFLSANNSYIDSFAGLKLLAGNSDSADKLYSELRTNSADTSTPDRLAWLGWWYYLAGNSPRAFEMLDSATQQRPSNVVYLVNFAWTALEQRRYEQALGTLRSARAQVLSRPYDGDRAQDDSALAEVSMANAVAYWLAQDRSNALSEYQSAINREPAWSNPAWITPQYSATVSRAIVEMRAETERRKKAADLNSRQAQ